MRTLPLIVLLFVLAACASTQPVRPTGTPLTLPSPTPIVAAHRAAAATRAPTSSPVPPTFTATSVPTATPTPTAPVRARTHAAPGVSGTLTRANVPTAISAALRAANITSRVYWFTSGGEEQLMIQYDSPIRYRPGYEDMLQKVKRVAAAGFLKIDPPLYTLYIAATDLTGTSDTVVRLRRYTVERWSRGEIGDADFYNNGFEPARISITCADGRCTGAKPTPFPTFPPFPFPFPTPTP